MAPLHNATVSQSIPLPVRLVEQLHRVRDAHVRGRAPPGRRGSAARSRDWRRRRTAAPVAAMWSILRSRRRRRHLRLGQVVAAGAAAADVGLAQLDQLEARDAGQQPPRRRAHALRMREVAGVVVRRAQLPAGAPAALTPSSTRNSVTSRTRPANWPAAARAMQIAGEQMRRTPSSPTRSPPR